MTTFTDDESLAVLAARELADGEVCFVGIGVPSEAAVLAKRTHAPDLTLIYESGVIGAVPSELPLSTGSPSVSAGAAMVADCLTVFGEAQAGRVDVAMLSAAQVDLFGNLNSTVIGDYAAPKVRMVGSGGAHDLAVLARRIVILMPHEPRRFVARVDFNTSPGLARATRAAHVRGPAALITPKARFDFSSGRLTLVAVMDGLSAADVLSEIPIDIAISNRGVGVLEPPSDYTLEVLRHGVMGVAR